MNENNQSRKETTQDLFCKEGLDSVSEELKRRQVCREMKKRETHHTLKQLAKSWYYVYGRLSTFRARSKL